MVRLVGSHNSATWHPHSSCMRMEGIRVYPQIHALRRLDSLQNQEAITNMFMEAMEACPEDLQKDMISIIPELLSEDEHEVSDISSHRTLPPCISAPLKQRLMLSMDGTNMSRHCRRLWSKCESCAKAMAPFCCLCWTLSQHYIWAMICRSYVLIYSSPCKTFCLISSVYCRKSPCLL